MLLLLLLLTLIDHQPVAADYKLTILHTNDVHARFVPFDQRRKPCSEKAVANESGHCYGGVARRHTAMQQLKKTAEDNGEAVLKLDAGDQFQGTIWYVAKKWGPIVDYMNMIKYDAMTFGNHEFDDGPDTLPQFINNLTTPIVSVNINDKGSPIKGLFEKSVSFTKNGRKIGVVGCTTQDTPKVASPGPQLEFSDEAKAVQPEVNRLIADGQKMIVLLSHAGFDVDKRMCAELYGVDIIVGGHSHTLLYTGKPPVDADAKSVEGEYPEVITHKDGKKCLVVQDYAYGKYLGHLKVVFDDDGNVKSYSGNPVLLDGSFKEDTKMNELLAPYKAEIAHFETTVVTSGHAKRTTDVKLDSNDKICRKQECAMANLIADASVYFYVKKYWADKELNRSSGPGWTASAICMINGGGVRDFESEPGKNLTLADLYTILPFGSTLDKVVINGSTILEVLEHSVADYDPKAKDWDGKFMQVSGLRVVYDISKPNSNRVVSVLVRCAECEGPGYEPLDMKKWYHVVTTSYITKQAGDGYVMIKDGKRESDDINLVDVDVFTEYLIKYAPVNTGLEQRIRFVTDETGEIDPGASTTTTPAAFAVARSINSRLIWIAVLTCAIRL